MRKVIILFTLIAIALGVSSCQKKQAVCEPTPEVTPVVQEYQPVHHQNNVDLNEVEKYHYFYAPSTEIPKYVNVKYNQTEPYADPILVEYHYQNGDTFTYVISSDFGLWENEYGRLRVVIDEQATVWMQGQTKQGKFHEFIFYGDPSFNGTKIKPNSYYNHPDGMIKYVE